MMRVTAFKDRTVAVFGLGASGTATARSADCRRRQGRRAGTIGEPDALLRPRRAFRWSIYRTADWASSQRSCSPRACRSRIPEPHWTVKKAQAAGVEVIGDRGAVRP